MCGSQQTGKFLNRWEYQTTLFASWETCMQVKKEQLKPNMEQWTGSKLGKEYVKAVYCHPAYLTYMQSTSCEMPGWINHKLESRWPGEISTTSVMQLYQSLHDPTRLLCPWFFLEARILEWVAIPFFRESPWPRDWNQVSCIAGRFFTVWTTREAASIQ